MRKVHFKHAEKRGPLLEGSLHLPEGSGPFPGAVICHPHPQFGGSMDVGLVVALAEGLAAAGWATLRFNFRGVGRSRGMYDEGIGEVDDAQAAVAFLGSRDFVLPSPLALVGYSFGAEVGLEAARQSHRIGAAVAIGLPLWRIPEEWRRDLSFPKMFIAGDRDMICPPAELTKFARDLSGPTEVRILAGADHYLAGREADVLAEVVRFLHPFGQPRHPERGDDQGHSV